MEKLINITVPKLAEKIRIKAQEQAFRMSCDDSTGELLRTLVSTKPHCKVLELGTGIGYSTSWILDGMDKDSKLITVESEEVYASIAKEILGRDSRIEFIVCDGATFIIDNQHQKFDVIFADTWPGKFYLFDEALNMLNTNGIFIIDDLLQQPNWLEGHEQKVRELLGKIEEYDKYYKLKLNWSTGIMILTKKPENL